MKFGLDNNIIDNIKKIFVKYPQVNFAVLYGSRAKGNFRPGSDIDITLKGNNIDLNILSAISNDLDDLLTPYKFDISVYSNISNPDLIGHIERVGVEIYKK